jgi:hypothetical protein
MTHVRQQIRERIATNVTGLTTTGARVYQSRIYNLEAANLPGLLVYTKTESSERATMGTTRQLERTLEIQVEGYARTSSDLDDVLDTISEEVENAISADPTQNGLAKDTFLNASDIDFTGDGDSPAGVVRLTFSVSYRTADTAAGTPL